MLLRLVRGAHVMRRRGLSGRRARMVLYGAVRVVQFAVCMGLDLRYMAHDYRSWRRSVQTVRVVEPR
jgi:ABC-type proline/glycine betaine transport system permease subunit